MLTVSTWFSSSKSPAVAVTQSVTGGRVLSGPSCYILITHLRSRKTRLLRRIAFLLLYMNSYVLTDAVIEVILLAFKGISRKAYPRLDTVHLDLQRTRVCMSTTTTLTPFLHSSLILPGRLPRGAR